MSENNPLPASPEATRRECISAGDIINQWLKRTMICEFTGPKPSFDGRRVDAIITSMQKFFDLEWDRRSETWSGSRPMSPDGMPLIGRPRNWSNLIIAAGHGMYGLTLAPATGLAVSQLLLDGRASVDLTPFDPDRF